MCPITCTYTDRKTKKKVTTTLTKDGGIRNTSLKGLAKLKTPFKKRGGTSTAGNSS